MSAEQDVLWRLMEIDDALAAAASALAKLPEERRVAQAKVAGERAPLDALRARVASVQTRRRDLEREIAGIDAEQRRFEGQLPAVKKNEEYQAMLHQIADLKRRRSDLETEILEGLEAEEREQGERPMLEQALAAAERDAAARAAAVDAAERDTRARVETLERDRAAECERLPAATRTRYERIRASRAGRAVAAIVKGACGACFRNQPPTVLQEARRRERLMQCDGCGRLLLWPPEGA